MWMPDTVRTKLRRAALFAALALVAVAVATAVSRVRAAAEGLPVGPGLENRALEVLRREPLRFLVTDRLAAQIVVESGTNSLVLGRREGYLIAKVSLYYGVDLGKLRPSGRHSCWTKTTIRSRRTTHVGMTSCFARRCRPASSATASSATLGHRRAMEYDYRSFFAEWRDWELFEDRFDAVNGVYAFRLKSEFPRLRGASQVLYIGMCDQNAERNRRPGLWHRLRNYRQVNKGASSRLKDIEAAFGGKSEVEYSYVPCDLPREVEKALLADYYGKHLEFPPLNRSG